MAFNIVNFFKNPGKTKHRPLVNQFGTLKQADAGVGYTTGTGMKTQFWKWFKSRPELNAPISTRVNDTITEPLFYDKEGNPLGRNKQIEATKFWESNFMKQRLRSIWFDTLVTGDGFGWVSRFSNDQLKEVATTIAKKFKTKYHVKEADLRDRILMKAIDEDLRKPRGFDYIASSTMEIVHDNYDVLHYVQNVGGSEEKFGLDEIIHAKLMSIDGKLTGYTPVESLQYEMWLLWFVKENMMATARNGGSMNKIFVLEEENPESVNFQFLKKQLMDAGSVENRHGNMVLTGKVDVTELDKQIKDMEYKDLALYVAGNIAYALNIPVSRIPYLIGSAANNGDAGGLAESGYWSMIEQDQGYIENLFNTQLFNKLGLSMKFKKPYKVDTLREANVRTMNADTVQKYNTILRNNKMKLSTSKLKTLLDLNDSDIEELSEEELMGPMQKSSMLGQNYTNNSNMQEDDKQKKADTKKGAAQNTSKGVGQGVN